MIDALAMKYVDECHVSYEDALELADFERQHKKDFNEWWKLNKHTLTPKRFTAPKAPAHCSISISCKDHLGNVYASKAVMCMAYGISYSTLQKRLAKGYDLEQALTVSNTARHVQPKHEKPKPKRDPDFFKTSDHLGNEFASTQAMCEHYGISPQKFSARRKAGRDLKTALTIKTRLAVKHFCQDHEGRFFSSQQEMCAYWHISPASLLYRLNKGWSLKDALTREKEHVACKACKDHRGVEFKSVKDMCRAWDTPATVYHHRISQGWTVKDALTKPVARHEFKRKRNESKSA